MRPPFDPAAQFEDERDKSRAQIDLEDMSRERSGASNKISRFFGDHAGPSAIEEKRKREFECAMTELALRLLDPEYKAAFDAANQAIDKAQAALDAALEENARHQSELEDRAVKLPDGRAVFLRKDGKGESVDGQIIPAEIMLTLDIPDDAPTIEDYDQARTRRRKLGGYGEDIDTAREKINDPDKPMSKPDLDDIKGELEETTREIEGTANPRASFNAVSAPPEAPKSLDLDLGEFTLPPPS